MHQQKSSTKKRTTVICSAMMATLLCFGCSNGGASSNVNDHLIQLSTEQITIGGKTLTEDQTAAVYSSQQVETHDDVAAENKELANTVVHITQGGEYEISGEAVNTQIRVTAPEEEVTLILNNVQLSCATAPAIYIEDAFDPQEAGKAGVTIQLADGSTNIINGSHVAEYIDENGNEVDNDGAISTNVSLTIDGSGTLQVTGDKEGIESKLHLTINNGNLQIVAQDDALNASEDGVSTITINDGIINCSVQNGEEGDGIDSNGYIYINGGSVLAQAHSNSQDSGLDSDLGIIINGGTVCATGNMYEEISNDSAQQYVQFYFAQRQSGGVPLVITDEDGNYILAYTPVNDYTILELSLPELVDGATYHLYSGGTITGTLTNGIYTQIDSYEGGTQLAHRGVMTNMGRPNFKPDGDMPRPTDDGKDKGPRPNKDENMKPEENRGEPPENMKPSDEGMEPPEGWQPPDDGAMPPGGFGGFGGPTFDADAEQSVDFTISSDSRVYQGIAPLTEVKTEAN